MVFRESAGLTRTGQRLSRDRRLWIANSRQLICVSAPQAPGANFTRTNARANVDRARAGPNAIALQAWGSSLPGAAAAKPLLNCNNPPHYRSRRRQTGIFAPCRAFDYRSAAQRGPRRQDGKKLAHRAWGVMKAMATSALRPRKPDRSVLHKIVEEARVASQAKACRRRWPGQRAPVGSRRAIFPGAAMQADCARSRPVSGIPAWDARPIAADADRP